MGKKYDRKLALSLDLFERLSSLGKDYTGEVTVTIQMRSGGVAGDGYKIRTEQFATVDKEIVERAGNF